MDRPNYGKPTGSPLVLRMERSINGKSPGSPQVSRIPDDKEEAGAATAGLEEDDDDDFNFNIEQPKGSDLPVQSRQQLFRSEEYRQLFHLPQEEVLIQDFNCALQKKILLQGHMYLFEHYVCFYSNIFGYEKKKVILLKDVTCVRKARTAGLFPNAIEIVSWGKKNFFASFLSRDEAYRLIVEGWSRHSRNATLASGSQSTPYQAINTTNPAISLETSQDPPGSYFSESSFGSRDIGEMAGASACQSIEENSLETLEVSAQGDADYAPESNSEDIANGSSAIHVSSWEVEEEDAPELPEHYKTVIECEFPVDVQNFFQLFYSNESAKFCEAFHRKCGDEDFQCTEWAKHRHFGHVRDVSFRHPINYYFGPKATYCQEVQRYRVYRNSHLIIETSQQMNDIPYGDYFRVEGRWDVGTLLGRDNSFCSVRISVDVSFSKKTVWKGKIEQGTFDECKESYSTWITEAHRVLHEKGIIGDKSVRGEHASPIASTFKKMHSENTKFVSNSSILKRKLEGGTQGHSKIVKNSSSAPLSQTARADGLKGSQQPIESTSSEPLKKSQQLQQECTASGFNSFSQIKPAILISVVVILLLTQIVALIALTRSSRMQYIPVGLSRVGEEYHGSYLRHSGREDAVAWLEQRTHFLQEEISIAEARLQNMQYNLNLLKVNMQLLEKSPKSPASSG